MPDIFVETHSHPRKPMFPLAEFSINPEGVNFENQHEEEKIHLFLRRHFITNLPWILFTIILSLLPIIIFPFINVVLPFVPDLKLLPIFTFFYYLAVIGIVALTGFINWYFNVYIVTNERIVDVDFINIIYREVSSTRLNLIQDVTVKAGGVVRAVFDYGDVFIQTAGTEVNFDFLAVPHPQKVAHEIEVLMREARKSEGISDLEQKLKEA